MIGNLARVPDEIRQTLHQHPQLIVDLIYGEEAPEAHPEMSKVTLLDAGEAMDLDKTWHVLHFLFTGTAWEGEFPANFLVSSGQPVGEEDVGYGPARSFSPAEVREIHTFLQNLNPTDLRSRMNPKEMEALQIYPSVWRADTVVDDEWPYFAGGLESATEFVSETVRQGKAMLVYIN